MREPKLPPIKDMCVPFDNCIFLGVVGINAVIIASVIAAIRDSEIQWFLIIFMLIDDFSIKIVKILRGCLFHPIKNTFQFGLFAIQNSQHIFHRRNTHLRISRRR